MIVNLPVTPEKCHRTALLCEMQNSFVWWTVYCFLPNVGGSEKGSYVVWY